MNNYENNLMSLAMVINDLNSRDIYGPRLYDACSNLFNYAQDIRPNKLLECSPNNLLPIGCAFATLATKIDYGNPDINSISAENALYCVMTYHKYNPNNFGNMPQNVAVSLLLSDNRLMHDGIMHVLRHNPHYLMSITEQALFGSGESSVRYRILKYLIPIIFDTNKMDFKINDLPLAPPKQLILDCIKSEQYKEADSYEGQRLFDELVDFCRIGVSQP